MNKTLLIGMLLMLSTASAVHVDIYTNDLTIGESLEFGYSILSEVDQEIIFIPRIDCPKAPTPPFSEETIMLYARSPYNANYSDLAVEDWFGSQTCTAYIEIISPTQDIFSKNFTITTDPTIDLKLEMQKKVFVLGETVDIEFFSDYGTELQAILLFPDGNSEPISFPFSMEATQIGTHTINITASKEDYLTLTKSIQFAVIEEAPTIQEPTFKEPEIIRKNVDIVVPEGFGTEEQEELPFGLIVICGLAVAILVASIVSFIKAKRAGRAI